MQNVPQFHCKIIDLSADYRFEDPLEYEKIYGIRHIDKKRKAVYGLPELFREQIKKADLIANPGCYVTASILATLPIQKYADYIVFDCKSGFSGAGKEPSYVNDPKNYTDNVIPYKLTKHRHKYEIQQFIKTKLSFTPQVVPFFRGMLCVAHILLKKGMSPEKARELYKHFYRNHPFVKIVDKIPEIKDTQNNNYCFIGGFEIDENNQLVVVSTIDNLLKGASGQAVQNMNLMLGFKEDEGLRTP
jgi:N-acetyl-gamma-glutamyl-phosphate reductase